MVITLIPGCAILNAESWSSGQTCSKMSLAGRARAEPCRDVDGIASSRILPRSVVSCKSKTTHQVPVVQTSDSTIHHLNPAVVSQGNRLRNPVANVIDILNNWGRPRTARWKKE